MTRNDRLSRLPRPSAQAVRDRLREALARGIDVIGLEMGDPDQPTPEHIIEALTKAASDPTNHRYPVNGVWGLHRFRDAIAGWYGHRFGVTLEPSTEVLPLLGSKEGGHHLALATLGPGDVVLVPDPSFFTYQASAILAGAEAVRVPLLPERGYLVDFDLIEPDVARRAKLMWLNYPHNPTGAVADLAFYERAVEFAVRHEIALISDNPYSELCFDGVRAPSILEIDGAKDLAIEFNSLSKTYNMAGWRLAMAVGNRDLVARLARIKETADSGVFTALQHAGIAALEGPQDIVRDNVITYQRRRDLVVEKLRGIGHHVEKPKGSIYVWVPTPHGLSSVDFTLRLLDGAGVAVIAGSSFGIRGEGFVRLSITVPDARLEEALDRVRASWERISDPHSG